MLDFFAGSGTTGAAALECGRSFVLIDSNDEAIAVMKRRFEGLDVDFDEIVRGAPESAEGTL